MIFMLGQGFHPPMALLYKTSFILKLYQIFLDYFTLCYTILLIIPI